MRRLGLALLAWSGLAAAQPPTRGAVQALAADAAQYARHYDVTPLAAIAALRGQEASVPATDALAAAFAPRLAGLWLEHRPQLRIVVLLTGDTPEPDRTIDAGGIAVPVTFRTGGGATRAAVLAAIAAHQAEIRDTLIEPPGMGADPRDGRLLLTVGASDADLTGLPEIERQVAAIAGVPVRAIVPGRESDTVAGGEVVEGVDPAQHRRFRCTAGFVVTDGTRTALTTAAHCPDSLTHIAPDGTRTPLTLLGAWGARYQDVQIHAAPQPLGPLFHAGADPAATRAVVTWRNRASTRAGDFVCHQGEASGYSCAEVLLPDYAPPGDLCAGPCPASWVAVAGPDCRHGDSGGPVFLGTAAFGVVKGGSYRADGRCSFFYYMSTDMLPEGWSLLHL